MEIKFTPNVDLGTILQIISFVATVVIAYMKLVNRIEKMDLKLNILWGQFLSESRASVGREQEVKHFFEGDIKQ